MDELKVLIGNIIFENSLIEAILSDQKSKDANNYTKVIIKPITLKGTLLFQFSFYYTKKVLHENLEQEEAIIRINGLFADMFKQASIYTQDADIQVLTSKKGKVTVLKKTPTKKLESLEHNRNKKYIIEEGTPVDFLIELGVMNKEGKVLAKKYDKFKQINRFLEMIEDVVPHLKKDKELNIIDFGCGKSYLTFVMYYYLKNIMNLNIKIIGLDLKEDVINTCNALTQKLGWDQLHFTIGDIAEFIPEQDIDMVVTLHACDTATDAALEKAIKWNADVILSVPCCQHELNGQIQNELLYPMLKYGLIKERFAALATDAIRANILELMGYKVQILEFIDMEHTPKNILIRAVKDKKTNKDDKMNQYMKFKEFLNATPYLEKNMNLFGKNI
jgi:SAM-dependent methyltransferase